MGGNPGMGIGISLVLLSRDVGLAPDVFDGFRGVNPCVSERHAAKKRAVKLIRAIIVLLLSWFGR
jgi:hypothetical protein